MKIPYPFLPVEVREEGLNHRVNVVGREMLFGADGMPVSVKVNGEELLAGPVRFVGAEDGEPICWRQDYEDNESESFIQKRCDREAVLCGAMASPRFILDSCIRIGYDGGLDFDVKLMPMGKTVAQVFGLAEKKPLRYRLDRLWLEIPLRKEIATHYSQYPNSRLFCSDGSVIEPTGSTTSGAIPGADLAMPFKALCWLGDEERGFGFFADRDRNWQPADPDRAVEVIHTADATVLRVRLLDSQPVSWKGEPENGLSFPPVCFSFGLQATPVKPFPKNPYPIHGLHIDCFIKTKGNYIDYLSAENRFERLSEKGVDTLILHEKWNKSQNWFEISEYTEKQIRAIVSECHRRGIRVLVYFGYEISSMAPIYSEYAERVCLKEADGTHRSGWYRVPFQRDHMVCYNNEWSRKFVDGVANLMDTVGIDGVYLDGTARPHFCANERHGCGWRDERGALHGSYPVRAVRDMFRDLYETVHARGGMINVHSSGYQNFTALPYIDLNWYGEHLQLDYVHGNFHDVPLDYFRTEYTGRNMGVPVEFIAYENRPIWNYENAVAMCIIHGILPRPNDIEGPLDQTAELWKIFDRFPIVQSAWCPYWTNGAETSDERVKISYYRYESVGGEVSLLAFIANTCKEEIRGVSFTLREEALPKRTDAFTGKEVGAITLKPYEYRILYLR